MTGSDDRISGTWRTAHGDLSDDEWTAIADLVEPPQQRTRRLVGRPAKWSKRDIVNAIFYVTATGCQWRALPPQYPHWNTVHGYHRKWSYDGTWEQIVDRLRDLVREREGRDPEPSAGSVDARSVRGAATVTSSTRGYDGGKKISGRKTFGFVDTCGFLLGVSVLPANVSDNFGGSVVVEFAAAKSDRLELVWCDGGFKKTFIADCRSHGIVATVVNRISAHTFEVLPRRWVIERTWSWLMNNRRLQIDYERDPVVTEGFIWAAHARQLLRRLTRPSPTNDPRSALG